MPNESHTPPIVQANADIDSILQSPSVAKYYANGFTVGHSLVEATILLQQGKVPIAAISVPFSGLKTLQEAIGIAIQHIEKGLGEEIPTIQQIHEKWGK